MTSLTIAFCPCIYAAFLLEEELPFFFGDLLLPEAEDFFLPLCADAAIILSSIFDSMPSVCGAKVRYPEGILF